MRNVRFDESLGALHGYDFDFCLQVREAGRKVVNPPPNTPGTRWARGINGACRIRKETLNDVYTLAM